MACPPPALPCARMLRISAVTRGKGVAPDGLTVRVKRDSWPIPPIFKLIAAKGPVDPIEMMRVFNMGVGFVMIVSPHFAKPIINRLRRMGERAWVLGKVRKGGPELQWA